MSGRDRLVAKQDVAVFDPRAPRDIWLDGDSVMCACPDCHAPMTIRLWLMMADCWNCGCSIELTEAQERRIHSILQQSGRAVPSQTSGPPQPSIKSATPPLPGPRHRRPADAPRRPDQRLAKSQAAPVGLQPSHTRSMRDWFDQVPAWLVSMLFHMAVLALMALFFLDADTTEDAYITLSTESNRWQQSGGDVTLQNPQDSFHYDLPVPPEDRPKTQLQRRELAKADQQAKQLRMDADAVVPELPSLEQVKQQLRSADSVRRVLAARDPRVRVEVVQREGGTTLTEAAVARGLQWLARHQQPDGSWSLVRFSHSPGCKGRCRGEGHISSRSAATSLSLLPFLGAGQTHQVGMYRDTVSQGLRWLMQHQKPDGDLRANSQSNAGMYAHGQGAIVLCEAYALTGDEQLREAAQRAIDFIVQSQHADGGWRYEPGQLGDTSVLGWQLMAMQSAVTANLDVPQEAFNLAYEYLESVSYDEGSRYSYQPERRPTHVMTAEALLCRIYMGWMRDYAPLQMGVRYLSREYQPRKAGTNFYYWYYATQVMHHYGGPTWEKWNLEMRDILVDSQRRKGHEAGSWDPKGGHASKAGRIYSTALAICSLEVYYRHAPIFRQLELAADSPFTP